ncbi:TetR/AcrR family transcriptional regulator [Pseudoalteromonas denitrificans]|uniref:Transcriptional regulator, TetR family n=1 Tax=Pseudoalteromonas denitrificans DSM 6059 TaxID=1123010 RepID=A0A1I1EN13_9GAMM|nr:TetR/AcrR family transcriptional regulator [Pseudoalteromonas denitrificans]SFB88579.1 transcriptional regulator, TetR family [Pseudoalteromonas denitrificans DSM 6059]
MVTTEVASKRTKSQLKREQIIEAATKLFIEQGYPNTSMDKIAKEAGVSKQTVYSHFTDKDTLFVETVGSRCSASEFSGQLYHPESSLQDNLFKIVKTFSDLVLSDDAIQVYTTCVSHRTEHPQLGSCFYCAGPKMIQDQVSQCLAKLSGVGQLNINDTRFATLQLLGMVQGDWHLKRTLGHISDDVAPSDEYLKDCVNRFVKSYS